MSWPDPSSTVEIEALPKRILLAILEDAIEAHIDRHALQVARVAEESEPTIVARIAATAGFGDTSRKPRDR
jgi:hypothetical protein